MARTNGWQRILEGAWVNQSSSATIRTLARDFWRGQNKRKGGGPFRSGDVGEYVLHRMKPRCECNNADDAFAMDLAHPDGLIELKTDLTGHMSTHIIDRTNRWDHDKRDDGPWRAAMQGAKWFVILRLPDHFHGKKTALYIYDCIAFRDRCDALIEDGRCRPMVSVGKDRKDGLGTSKGEQYSFKIGLFKDLELHHSVLD